MSKNTSAAGNVVFLCRCQLIIEGDADDSLMAEEYLETTESDQKHEVFIENSPFDAAANVVLKDCPKCKLNFMVMIRIGVNETSMYTCSCGFIATHDEYNKLDLGSGNLGSAIVSPSVDSKKLGPKSETKKVEA